MVWCDTTRIKNFKGPLKSEGDLHAKDGGRVHELQTLHLTSMKGQKEWSLVPPSMYTPRLQCWLRDADVKSGDARAQGSAGKDRWTWGRSCEDPEFQRLKHRNGTMECSVEKEHTIKESNGAENFGKRSACTHVGVRVPYGRTEEQFRVDRIR